MQTTTDVTTSYERTSIAAAETRQIMWAWGYMCSLLWSSLKFGISKSYYKYFPKLSPWLAGIWLCSTPTAQFSSLIVTRTLQTAGLNLKWLICFFECYVQKMFHYETFNFHSIFEYLVKVWAMNSKWLIEAAFYFR